MTDISVEDLLKRSDNIYEAVVAMFKRARQINDEQKQQIEMEMETAPVLDNRENEEFDDVEIDRDALMREHKKYPKPSRLAIEEMAEGKIDFRIIDPDEEEKTQEDEKASDEKKKK